LTKRRSLVREDRKKDIAKDIALERCAILYRLATKEVKEGHPDRARKYVELGIRLLQKYRLRKPVYYRRWVCKRCHIPLIPGVTASVRVRSTRTHVIVVKKCSACGWISRTPLRKQR